VSRDLRIAVSLATFLANADEMQLKRLTGGFGSASEGDDG
jgi:hypothetical protein